MNKYKELTKAIKMVNEGISIINNLGFRILNPDCSKREDGLKFADYICGITDDTNKGLVLGVGVFENE